MRKIITALLMGGFTLMALPASAQSGPAPHAVTGFRSALFGMDAAAVRQAIAQDFKAPPEALREVDNPAESTRVLVLRLPALEPGPGEANVSYILAPGSRRLVSVRVVWSTPPTPTEDERNRVAAAGLQLASYFTGLAWGAGQSMTNRADGPGTVVLFAGVDARKAAVEVRLSGVALVPSGGAVVPPPAGPAQLTLGYFGHVGTGGGR